MWKPSLIRAGSGGVHVPGVRSHAPPQPCRAPPPANAVRRTEASLEAQLDVPRRYNNFARPHQSLRQGRERRIPAMAAASAPARSPCAKSSAPSSPPASYAARPGRPLTPLPRGEVSDLTDQPHSACPLATPDPAVRGPVVFVSRLAAPDFQLVYRFRPPIGRRVSSSECSALGFVSPHRTPCGRGLPQGRRQG